MESYLSESLKSRSHRQHVCECSDYRFSCDRCLILCVLKIMRDQVRKQAFSQRLLHQPNVLALHFVCLFFLISSQLWVNIVNGDIQDSTRSDLYEYIVDFLTYCLDQELVWTHADWLLQKSEEVCVS